MPEDIQNSGEFSFSDAPTSYPPQKIKVIGVGGGGNNAINHMYNMGVRNVSFIVANTDKQALENSPVPNKVLLGPNITRGRGAGNVPERARQAAEESADEINALFDDETDMVFITAGMGGGTGTGASPVISRIAKERGLLTIGIVTIPFMFEGKRKIVKALDGAKEMGKYVDALLVINNERLGEIYKDYEFLNAFGKADDILSMAAISISEIVTCDGYINLDFNDVDNTLRNGGTAIIATGYGEGENRVTKAIEDALNSPLLKNTDIFGSKKLLFNLYFSRDAEDKFKIDETDQITSFVSNIDPEVDVIWGVAFDESLGDKVKFTILAAGFDVTVSADETIKSNPVEEEAPIKITTKRNDEARIEEAYGKDKLDQMTKSQAQQRCRILKPGEFDNDSIIEDLNEKPALNRDKKALSNMRNARPHSDSSGSRTIAFDDF